MTGLLRVFPRRTSYTPLDELAFVGDPPLIRPEADEVHVSVTFTWDREKGQRLAEAWGQYYSNVHLGGPAFGDGGGPFIPGRYVKPGVTFATRGCDRRCPWCLVPEREGRLATLPVQEGWIIQDNNLLQAPREHIDRVLDMLRQQRRRAVFAGGLDARLVDDWFAKRLKTVRIKEVFLAADTPRSLKPLRAAVARLSYLPRHKLRCYVMIGYRGEGLPAARRRLQAVWDAGCLPFAQLYQPPYGRIEYGPDWAALARTWSRPAAMVASHKEEP